jgi:hypothetical protein
MSKERAEYVPANLRRYFNAEVDVAKQPLSERTFAPVWKIENL